MKPVNILLITPDYPPDYGGIQRLLHRMIRHAPNMTATVVTPDAPGAAAFDDSTPEQIRRVGRAEMSPVRSGLALNLAALRQRRDFRPDVVVSGHIIVSPAAAALARSYGVPLVQYVYAKELGSRPTFARFALRVSDATVGVSRHTLRIAERVGGQADRLHWIPPGVDDVPPIKAAAASQPTFITVARLDDRHKGHDVVIRAMPTVLDRLPNARYIVVGNGVLRGELERLASELQVSHAIKFVGSVPDADRDVLLASAHVFVLPSRLPPDGLGGDGFPLVYLEAAARGLPAVAGDVGGPPDAVAHDQTGILVDPEDPRAVAHALLDLLTDHDRRAKYGAAAVARAADYRWTNVATRFEKLLREL